MGLDASTQTVISTAAAVLAAASTILGVALNHYLSKRRRSEEGTLEVKLGDESTSTTLPARPTKRRKQVDRAMVALRLGVLSIPVPILAVPAIVVGVRALRELQGARGRNWSRTRARVGIALGSLMLLVLLVAFAGLV